jgi:hypothetical protein
MPVLAQTSTDTIAITELKEEPAPPPPAPKKQVVVQKHDSATRPVAPIVQKKDTIAPVVVAGNGGRHLSYAGVLKLNAWYNFFGTPVVRITEEHRAAGKEVLFYLLTGLLFFFAIIRVAFPKYFRNLMSLVFRASLKQKQIREQLMQTPLPSLLLNIFFVIVAGLYVLFLLQHYGLAKDTSFWLLLLYCTAAVGLVYIVKFIVLKFTGWVFNMREAADTYIFIVFLVNKLLGIFMLPVLILMAFSTASWNMSLLTVSYVVVFSFFAYRYIVSFAPVRREVKVSPFHFFMYLCAFEIVPLLLIYKVLLRLF